MNRSLREHVMDALCGNNGGNFGADMLKRSSEELTCIREALRAGMVDEDAYSAMGSLGERMLLAARILETEEDEPSEPESEEPS